MAEQTRPRRGYAVGVQMFDWIRERGSVYVDKTEYVWKMVSTDSVNFFLSRPRRMDIALKLPDAIYILELKYGKTADEATDQIIAKNYAVRFASDVRPVWAVGMNISQDRRTIDSYRIVQVK